MVPPAHKRPRVALVLAGGGARGAYEVGALSVLLPRLEHRGERPDVIVGTSVGAINAAFLAATAADPVDDAIRKASELWSEITFDDVLKPLLSPDELAKAVRSIADFVGFPGPRLSSLLEPTPLAHTLRRRIPFDRIRPGPAGSPLTAAAVVATSAATGRSVVFHSGGGHLKPDHVRGIDYAETRIGEQHVRASAAIPTVFPAVHVTTPRAARGWYFDGGTRLNTPIKPALALDADRVIVIALNSLVAGGKRSRPDALDGASQLVQAVLVDPLVHDVQTLATINLTVGKRSDDPRGGTAPKRIPYILVAPDRRDVIGEIAARIYRDHYSGLIDAARSPSLGILGRALDAGSSPGRGELFSYLFFAPEFAEALMKRGREDAERWLRQRHDEGPWRLRRPPLPA